MKLLRDWAAGSEIDQVVLVRDVEQRHRRDGSPFMRMTLGDRSGTVPSVLWEASEVAAGDPARVIGLLEEHPRYGRQVTIRDLRVPAREEVDWNLLAAGPCTPLPGLLTGLERLVDSVDDEHLRGLLHRLLGSDSESGSRYRVMPAAKRNHHAYRHGLLEHSLQVAELVSDAAAVFCGIDRDLAVTGALLHDIGKLEAYRADDAGIDLTDTGRLEGEIALGYSAVRRAIDATPGFPPDRAQALLHIILSHHGRLEYGSPVVPCTREALLVHAVDNLSGQLGAFDRVEREAAPDARWSRFDRILGTAAFFTPLSKADQP